MTDKGVTPPGSRQLDDLADGPVASQNTRWRPLHSLMGRFILASFFLLPLFIWLSGTLLVDAFEHSRIKAEQEKLQAHLYVLLSLTEVEERTAVLPDALTEPRFNQQGSGLYGFVYSDKDNELWRSPSAMLLSPALHTRLHDNSDPFRIGQTAFRQIHMSGVTLNQLAQDIEWINDDNSSTNLRFVVTSDNSPLQAELNSYQKRLWQWLTAMGLSLLAIQLLILYWGLKPLRHLSQQLHALKNNDIQQLDNDYPKEIQPVTENFNAILIHEKQQRERYRNTMSDLAHSLKTPLAVIHSQLDSSTEQAHGIREQLDRINQIISHQLKRAVIRVNQNIIASNTDKIAVKPLVNRLIKILDKVYTDKNMLFTNLADDSAVFFGDEADLLEVMGNLLDNACKYGNGNVTITASSDDSTLFISISDNGDGIPESLQAPLLKRGARGDTAHTGQGIGLSVAVDIISSYGGGLSVENNSGTPHLNGACFLITLPNH